MSNNSFVEILPEFQEAHATCRDSGFYIIGLTGGEEWRHTPSKDTWRRLGSTMNKNEYCADDFLFFGVLIDNLFFEPKTSLIKQCDCFEKLAAKAGAILPVNIKIELPDYDDNPVSLWLSYVYSRMMPGENGYTPMNSEEHINSRRLQRGSTSCPFRASMEAIEEGGLTGNEKSLVKLDVESTLKVRPSTTEQRPKPRITKDEANIKARELLQSDSNFAHGTQKDWSVAIGCSTALVNELPARKAIMEIRRKNKPVQPKAAILDEISIEKNGVTRHREIERLAKEQDADKEPSPLQDDPVDDPPLKVKMHKKM